MVPGYARLRHGVVEERLHRLRDFSERFPWNTTEIRSDALGVITSSVASLYVREVLPEASILRLAMSYPLPVALIRSFAAQVKTILVVEELDGILETEVRALGIEVEGKRYFPLLGELQPDTVAAGLRGALVDTGVTLEPSKFVAFAPDRELPSRPPVQCPGCGHRSLFYVLSTMRRVLVTGDIGCYTLSVASPLEAIDTCVCMGAGVGHAHGFEKAFSETKGNVVAVIGDSTFVHSGITGLIDIVYNNGSSTVIILDNRTTAMTGRQDHPATGRTLMGEDAPQLDLAELCRTIGVADVREVDPYDLEATRTAIKGALAYDGPSVIITTRPCILLSRTRDAPYSVDVDACTGCWACLRLGCPALVKNDEVVEVDDTQCVGCGVCVDICRYDAFVREAQ